MEKKVEGAWLLHHTRKLQKFEHVDGFDEIYTSGKCGILLSALSESENETTLNYDKVKVLAKASGINVLELPSILNRLAEEELINQSSSGDIAVLGITSTNVLTHTAAIYKESGPDIFQDAALTLAELVSDSPVETAYVKEFIADTHKISSSDLEPFLETAVNIGLVDAEQFDKNKKLYFNGNLFRREHASKANNVLSSLTPADIRNINEFDELLSKKGCITTQQAQKILSESLFSKLQSIGMYDVNMVSNEKEVLYFITKPAAFGKYGNPFVEDALDLAKAFVTSLSYGMHHSSNSRGKITMLKALLGRLISGNWVGPATAIGQDYKVLELKGVLALQKADGNKFNMRLLKKEIGEIALNVLDHGDGSEVPLLSFTSTSVSKYSGPETNREIVRKQQSVENKKAMVDALRTLRSN